MKRDEKEPIDPWHNILNFRAKYNADVYTQLYGNDPGCKVMLRMVMEEYSFSANDRDFSTAACKKKV